MHPAAEFDLVIIGAGVNGAGIARDAAMRGLSVAVLDQYDMCSGTSAWSSRLIHGGLRYLEYGEIPLVYESLHERRALRKVAPHLVMPLRVTIPVYRHARRGPLKVRLGMLAYDLLSIGKEMPSHQMLSRSALLAEVPGLAADGLRAGARYYDAQVTYAERLVLENLLAARSAGASIRTWQRVTAIEVSERRVRTIGWEDLRSGTTGRIAARVVVNAAGPWVDRVLGRAPVGESRLIGGTKGSHIVVSPFDGAPADAFYIEAAADGRPIFVLPWNGLYLVGTTDIRYEGAPDDVRASVAEVDYLLAELNRVFPQAAVGRSDIHYAYAGVRPLPYREKGPESAITRKHIIRQNVAIADNLVSIIGGKLTTYRSLAEQAVDRVGKLLGRKLPDCRTDDTPLPGGFGLEEARKMLDETDRVGAACASRLVSVYGGRAAKIAALVAAEPALGEPLNAAGRLLAAEVALAVRDEFARTLADIVFRRMMIGLDADQGRADYEAVTEVAAKEFGWDAEQRRREVAELTAYADSLRPA